MARSVTPDYWDEACKHLAKRDRVMRKLIPQFGERRLQARGDAFTTLARSIVGQQISVNAAQAVWGRFAALFDGDPLRVQPAAVLATAAPHIREAGLSARKVDYLLDLAQHFESGAVHVRQWQQMEDEEHLCRPAADAADADQLLDDLLVVHLAPARRPHGARLEVLGKIAEVLDLAR